MRRGRDNRALSSPAAVVGKGIHLHAQRYGFSSPPLRLCRERHRVCQSHPARHVRTRCGHLRLHPGTEEDVDIKPGIAFSSCQPLFETRIIVAWQDKRHASIT